VLVIQIVTGIFLVMHYKPDANLAFASVEYIMRDVPWGWLIRYMHSTGAVGVLRRRLPAHVPRAAVRLVPQAARAGVDLRLRDLPVPDGRGLHGLPAALGPDVVLGRAGDREPVRRRALRRPDLALLIRGDYVVSDATLNRFFSFHVIAVPLVLLGLVVAHIIALHEVGSNNPDGVEIKAKKDAAGRPLDGIPFHPYYTVHDCLGVSVFLMLFSAIIFFAPELAATSSSTTTSSRPTR
jgi:ubiquinol-cytochrome c reductase cytochrome b subunit